MMLVTRQSNKKENGDIKLAESIRWFQFRDIRPKAASETLDLGDASRLLGAYRQANN